MIELREFCDPQAPPPFPTFPAEFGLRAFPGRRFRVNRTNSYLVGVQWTVYVDTYHEGEWVAFAKGSAVDLKAEMLVDLGMSRG